MSYTNQFASRLDRLWERRTAELRRAVIPAGRGALPRFTPTLRKRCVAELLDIASTILVARDAKKEFRGIVTGRKLFHIRGRGLNDRGKRLCDWVYAELEGPVVYAFWRGDRCLYVGKGRTPSRLYGYNRSAYLISADCLEVYFVRGRSYLGQAECLATHRFEPRDNKSKPARVRWGKECPICKKHDFIRDELDGLF